MTINRRDYDKWNCEKNNVNNIPTWFKRKHFDAFYKKKLFDDQTLVVSIN